MTTVTRVRGDDWSIPGTISEGGAPVDLTGATVTSMFREGYDSSNAYTFTVTVTDAANGELTLSYTDTQSTAVKPSEKYVYDIQVVKDGVTTTYGQGSKLVVRADATHS